MTATNTLSRVTVSGKGKALREAAFMAIAVDSFMAEQSRGALVATLRTALGNAPTDAQRAYAKQEYTVGRVASRLPAGEFPKGCTEAIDKLEYARDLIQHYAAPAKEGAKARKLRAGQKGRRTAVQHKVIRAAEESWSLIAGELGIGNARTLAEKNDRQAKRAPQMSGSTARGKAKGGAPAHAELVKPSKPLTADEAVQHITTQAAALLAFTNKHAKLVPGAFGEAVQAFKSAINKAANDYQVSKA